MKKIICIGLAVLVLGAAAWAILLRPSRITGKTAKEDFERLKGSFAIIAEYLTKNNVKTEIKGLITLDNNYGVPNTDADEFKKFNNAVEAVMKQDFEAIVSDGKSVEFRYQASGGTLSRKEISVIFNGLQSVDGRQTEPLADGWHLYVG